VIMTISDIKIKVSVKKKFYFWPVFIYLRLMIYMGKVSIHDASELMANKCIKVKADN